MKPWNDKYKMSPECRMGVLRALDKIVPEMDMSLSSSINYYMPSASSMQSTHPDLPPPPEDDEVSVILDCVTAIEKMQKGIPTLDFGMTVEEYILNGKEKLISRMEAASRSLISALHSAREDGVDQAIDYHLEYEGGPITEEKLENTERVVDEVVERELSECMGELNTLKRILYLFNLVLKDVRNHRETSVTEAIKCR